MTAVMPSQKSLDGGGFEDFGDQFVAGPGVALNDALDAAAGIHDDGPKVVVDAAGAIVSEIFPKLGAECREIGKVAGDEIPAGRIKIAQVGVGFEGGGGVVFRVERNGDKMPVRW